MKRSPRNISRVREESIFATPFARIGLIRRRLGSGGANGKMNRISPLMAKGGNKKRKSNSGRKPRDMPA